MDHATRQRHVARTGGGRRRGGAVGAAVVLIFGATLAACGSSNTTTTTTTSTTTTTIPATLGSYLPLFPFTNASQVAQWEQQYAANGTDAWHLDDRQSAVRFAKWLGFPGINRALEQRLDRLGAHMTVGFVVPGTTTTTKSAIVHLMRWGSSDTAPWEAVGTDDTTLTITAPGYASNVTSPVNAGGLITGVDENIKVRVLAPGTAANLGVSCCSPAGGTRTSWFRMVSFNPGSNKVVVFVAQTGGHVATVERFAVTAARI